MMGTLMTIQIPDVCAIGLHDVYPGTQCYFDRVAGVPMVACKECQAYINSLMCIGGKNQLPACLTVERLVQYIEERGNYYPDWCFTNRGLPIPRKLRQVPTPDVYRMDAVVRQRAMDEVGRRRRIAMMRWVRMQEHQPAEVR